MQQVDIREELMQADSHGQKTSEFVCRQEIRLQLVHVLCRRQGVRASEQVLEFRSWRVRHGD